MDFINLCHDLFAPFELFARDFVEGLLELAE